MYLQPRLTQVSGNEPTRDLIEQKAKENTITNNPNDLEIDFKKRNLPTNLYDLTIGLQ